MLYARSALQCVSVCYPRMPDYKYDLPHFWGFEVVSRIFFTPLWQPYVCINKSNFFLSAVAQIMHQRHIGLLWCHCHNDYPPVDQSILSSLLAYIGLIMCCSKLHSIFARLLLFLVCLQKLIAQTLRSVTINKLSLLFH